MVNFKLICDDDKPRERLIKNGASSLSNEELIAIILKTGSKDYSVMEVAMKVLESLGNVQKLDDIGINTLMKINGVGRVKAITIKAAIELGRRVYSSNNNYNNVVFDSAFSVYNYFYSEFINKKQEYFYCIYVDVRKKFIDKRCLFVGTLNMSLVSTREIFKEAYLLSASGIICVHNHPSGDASPSRQDKIITNKIKELGVIHEIILIDHVIIGNKNYYSFNEEKLFFLS